MLIRLDKIRIDGGTQQRAEINNETVSDYADAMQNGVEFPPINVVFDGTDYWLVDGFHRLHANRKAGFLDINVDVKDGTRRDAVLLSLGVNHAHGLRRTNADKRKAVETMLNDAEWSCFSNVEIAKNCYVSEQLVRSLRVHINNSIKSNSVVDKNTQQSKTNQEIDHPQPEQQAPVQHYDVQEDEGAPPEYSELAQLKDENAELRDTIEQLVDKCAKLGDEEFPLAEMYEELKKENSVLKVQVEMITKSRNQLQTENVELMKQIKYWRKVAGK